jgi:hypothetical protein
MTLYTGYVFVTAVELKPGFIVIELNRLPPVITVAPGA